MASFLSNVFLLLKFMLTNKQMNKFYSNMSCSVWRFGGRNSDTKWFHFRLQRHSICLPTFASARTPKKNLWASAIMCPYCRRSRGTSHHASVAHMVIRPIRTIRHTHYTLGCRQSELEETKLHVKEQKVKNLQEKHLQASGKKNPYPILPFFLCIVCVK